MRVLYISLARPTLLQHESASISSCSGPSTFCSPTFQIIMSSAALLETRLSSAVTAAETVTLNGPPTNAPFSAFQMRAMWFGPATTDRLSLKHATSGTIFVCPAMVHVRVGCVVCSGVAEALTERYSVPAPSNTLVLANISRWPIEQRYIYSQ